MAPPPLSREQRLVTRLLAVMLLPQQVTDLWEIQLSAARGATIEPRKKKTNTPPTKHFQYLSHLFIVIFMDLHYLYRILLRTICKFFKIRIMLWLNLFFHCDRKVKNKSWWWISFLNFLESTYCHSWCCFHGQSLWFLSQTTRWSLPA